MTGKMKMKRIIQIVALAVALASVLAVVMASAKSSQGENHGGDKATAINPAVTYTQNCATCHGKDGRGKTIKGKLKHVPDLSDAEWQERASDDHIYNAISNGRGKMPAFGKRLSAEQIESLAGYVRRFKK